VKRSLMTLLFLALFGVSSASLAIDANQKKCFGKLHACFGADTDLVIDSNPQSTFQCVQACAGLIVGTSATVSVNDNVCTTSQCELRCYVAFGITTEVCE